jgi:hypothetical protein
MATTDGLTADTIEQVTKLFAAAGAEGMTLKIRSGRRTCAQQAEQYAIGRQPGDTRAIVTKAKGCQSWHVQGRAVDIDIVGGPKDYARLGAIWKSFGGKWGGDFPPPLNTDVGHLEFHPGLTSQQACPDPDNCVDTPIVTARSRGTRKDAAIWGGLLAVGVGAVLWRILVAR